MRVLVTGSTGFIGRHLVPRLLDEGDDVFALVRREGETPLPGVTQVFCGEDLVAGMAAVEWPDELDLVVHLAALNPPRGTPEASDRAALMRANAAGTRALAERAVEAGVPRFLFLSSANVHVPQDDRPIIEDDIGAPADPYAESKLAAEGYLGETLAGSGTRYTVLRPAPVYGPGGGGAVAALHRLAKSRLPLPFASLEARRSILAVENLVDALLWARAHPGAQDDVFLVADDEAVTLAELVEMMRETEGRPRRLFRAPASLVRLGLGALGRGEMARRLSEDFVVDTSKIRLRLGWRPRLSTREGLVSLGHTVSKR
ncbi:NAD-dependent epimerase/dehydratase family protein [Aureimonas mangrovi]|uniref:NAD-dependent epimerase/dehydratase family protein n=1 Tax=Aureimonas mangrovi TaxID=2758041 RepID=UPI00163D8418|nr:NAD-dependent epimerase/dehydratase family protein [Aureimonas mangrovi]